VLEFFITYAPDPHHWTLNSCFGVFLSVWMHLGPFPYCMKLAAKCAKLVQLMQKFVPRSRIGVFRDECTQSTPMVPKLMFWCVSYRFGAFASIWLPCENRGEMFRTSAKVCATKSCWNFAQRTHPEVVLEFCATNTPNPPHWTLNSYFVAFCTIWVHLEPLSCLTKLGAKRFELM